MKIGHSDTNLSQFEEIKPSSDKEDTYSLLKMMHIPLIPNLLQS